MVYPYFRVGSRASALVSKRLGECVERLLADRRVPLDLRVYTPREHLYRAGSPFIEGVVESGRVLEFSPHGEPTPEDARRALRAAETVMTFLRAALGDRTHYFGATDRKPG